MELFARTAEPWQAPLAAKPSPRSPEMSHDKLFVSAPDLNHVICTSGLNWHRTNIVITTPPNLSDLLSFHSLVVAHPYSYSIVILRFLFCRVELLQVGL